MKNNIQAFSLLASFILVAIAFQGCKTTHVVHIHNGKPVEPAPPQELLPVDITMIIDRSGSMGNLQEQVIASYNEFITDQQSVEGEASISLIQFDDAFEPNYTGVDIQKATELNSTSYVPRGSTALFDAIGRAITEAKTRIQPGSSDVVFVITTDGMENASKEYTGTTVKEMIADCESQYGWHFMYLAASDEAFAQYETIGIDRASCFQIKATPESWGAAQKNVSQMLIDYRDDGARSQQNLLFDKADEE
jgi:hypothetical protein